MKERFSAEKTEWSDEREKQYKQDCYDIVYRFGDKLRIESGGICLIKEGMEIQIDKPLKPKTFWFETWLKLKAIYELG